MSETAETDTRISLTVSVAAGSTGRYAAHHCPEGKGEVPVTVFLSPSSVTVTVNSASGASSTYKHTQSERVFDVFLFFTGVSVTPALSFAVRERHFSPSSAPEDGAAIVPASGLRSASSASKPSIITAVQSSACSSVTADTFKTLRSTGTDAAKERGHSAVIINMTISNIVKIFFITSF